MRIIIAGGGRFDNYELLCKKLDAILSNAEDYIEIVSGRCDTGNLTFTADDGTQVFGADGLGERYAKEKGYHVSIFPANWKKFDKAAGPIRNEEMSRYATHCICFFDGFSKGTLSMIGCAKKQGLPTRVIRY